MEFTDANRLLDPGYLVFESGYQPLSDGKQLVAALTRIPGCRAKMVGRRATIDYTEDCVLYVPPGVFVGHDALDKFAGGIASACRQNGKPAKPLAAAG